MKIRILKDGLYANINRRAQECKAGEEFETGNAYAGSLVEDGYAEFGENSEPEETPKKTKPGRSKKEKATPEKPSNPFVG